VGQTHHPPASAFQMGGIIVTVPGFLSPALPGPILCTTLQSCLMKSKHILFPMHFKVPPGQEQGIGKKCEHMPPTVVSWDSVYPL
jgi:hypothetical protein